MTSASIHCFRVCALVAMCSITKAVIIRRTPTDRLSSDPIEEEYSEIFRRTHHWVEEEQCAHFRAYNQSRSKRSPLTMLSQFGATKEESKKISALAYTYENLTATYGKSFVKRQSPNMFCFTSEETCFPLRKFRETDGSCNNPMHPQWGKPSTPLVRYLPPQYHDRMAEFRRSVTAAGLPSARAVSAVVFTHENVEEDGYTALITHFGQFLDHDMGHTPTQFGVCGCAESATCAPITIPSWDPFFRTGCFPFSRSLPVLAEDCLPGPRQQMNQITSFIDGSAIYGSSSAVELSLRDSSEGKGFLKMDVHPLRPSKMPLLPKDVQMSDCTVTREVQHCGRSGDTRAAEAPGLTALHTLFHRYHNKIAMELSGINGHWNDDRVFIETRRIVVAILQHITYKEYLPLILGPETMKTFMLWPSPGGFSFSYDYREQPGLANVVSTAAMRFGHSQVSPDMPRVDTDYQEAFAPLPLAESFFNGTLMIDETNGGIDSLVLGMLVQRVQKVDTSVDIVLSRHLFNLPPNNPALDLVAFNIQRGRDHGLPAYVAWRSFCNLREFNSFDDMSGEIKPGIINRMRSIYMDVRDVDVFVGMLSEEPHDGALVGPTSACLLGRQFRSFKIGDRFWYEAGGMDWSFTKDQLTTIRTMTMSRVICDTLDNVDTVQSYAFREADTEMEHGHVLSFSRYSGLHEYPDTNREMPGFSNFRLSCDDTFNIPKLSLNPWREQQK